MKLHFRAKSHTAMVQLIQGQLNQAYELQDELLNQIAIEHDGNALDKLSDKLDCVLIRMEPLLEMMNALGRNNSQSYQAYLKTTSAKFRY